MPAHINHIEDLVTPDLIPDNTAIANAVALDKRVAIALWTMTSTAEMRTIECLFGPRGVNNRCVSQMFLRSVIRRGLHGTATL